MASIHKRPRSPYWVCSFRLPDGRWAQRSTKKSNRAQALAVCVGWEKAAHAAKEHHLTAVQARKILSELVSYSSGESLTNYTVKGWFDDWMKSKAGGASEATLARYDQVTRDFLDHLGARAGSPIVGITPGDIASFRDYLRDGGRAISTCNTVIKKVLNVPFEAARRLGYISTNPVHGVDPLKDRGSKMEGREPFSAKEIADLAKAAKGSDWEGAVIIAATTGLRLGDIVALTWAQVDLDKNLIRAETAKTGATVVLPIHHDLEDWLSGHQQGVGQAPLLPELHGQRTGGCNGLSAQFRKLMKTAKVVSTVAERKGKAGRTRRAKGFHSLRHSFVSGLANAGVHADIRQKLAGHADERVHQRYSHHELQTLRAAVDKLPSIGGSK